MSWPPSSCRAVGGSSDAVGLWGASRCFVAGESQGRGGIGDTRVLISVLLL